MVKPDDHPSFDFTGKTSLWVDDIQWSPNDMFWILAFRSRDIAILSRLGGLVRFVPNLGYDLASSMRFNRDHFGKEPRRFNPLVYPREAQILDRKNDTEKVKVLFERNRFLVKDNRVFSIFEYHQHEDILPMLGWCEKDELGFSFLRLWLSHETSRILPENLERIPVFMNSKLPQFEFEKNAEIDEIEEEQPAILTAAQIKPFEINKSQISNDSFNEEFKLDPEVLMSNFHKFLMSLRWTNSHPKNFKEWFLSIVDDCFYFCLKMNEPVYAYHLLKISKSFLQNYLFKVNPMDVQNDDNFSKEKFNPESHTLKDCLEYLTNSDTYEELNYKTYKEVEKQKHQDWKLREFTNEDISSEGNKSISFHKNYTLLVFYGLIQFRNYQANNFNILFLAFSWNILKKHFCPIGERYINLIVDLVYKNYLQKDKSDEFEMFLGKSGKNKLEGKDDIIEVYKTASKDTMFCEVLSADNFDNYMTTCQEYLNENYTKVLTNLSYLEEKGDIARWLWFLNQNKIQESFMIIKNLVDNSNTDRSAMESHDFVISTCLNYISESLSKSKGSLDLAGTTWVSFTDALNTYLMTLQSQITQQYKTFKNFPFENIKWYKGKGLNNLNLYSNHWQIW